LKHEKHTETVAENLAKYDEWSIFALKHNQYWHYECRKNIGARNKQWFL